MEPGKIVEYIDQQKIISAVVLDIKKKRLRLLTETNREVNISEGRLAYHSTASIDISESRDNLVKSLKKTSENREILKDKINIQELWELLNEENEWIDLSSMTEYCFSEAITPDHKSAVIRAFFDNRIYFKFNNDSFFPNSEKQVEKILAQRKEAERKQALIKTGGEWLNNALKKTSAEITKEAEEVIEIIKSYYLFEKDSKHAEMGKALLSEAGTDLNDNLFQLLVKLGIWDKNENIELLKLEVPTSFSHKNMEQAELLAKTYEDAAIPSNRKDLTNLSIITIDGESTQDFDDALSIEKIDDHYILGIHIVDVDHYIKKGDSLDQCGLNRGSSIYMPDKNIPMLPRILSENLCSLKQGKLRPAISTMVKLSKYFEILDYEIIQSTIRVDRQLNYTETSLMVESDEDIQTLYKIGKTFREKRLSQGAVQITLPEIYVSLGEKDEINIHQVDRESPSRMFVSEIMILSNWLSAKFLSENKLPAIFRSQPEPNARLYNGTSDSLFLNYMQRKQLVRASIGYEAEHHSGLGLNAYVTCTSPIRRYFDLVTQRQLKAGLGITDPYKLEEITLLYQSLEQTMSNVGRVQYMRQRYFLLKHLKELKGTRIEAIVLDKRRDAYFVLIKDYMIECKLPGRGVKLKPQDIIQVVVQHVNPKKDLISVFPG